MKTKTLYNCNLPQNERPPTVCIHLPSKMPCQRPYFVICCIRQDRVVKRFKKTFNYYSGNFVTQPSINTGSAFNMMFVQGSIQSRHLSDRNLERQYSPSKSTISNSSFSRFKWFYSRSPILLKHCTAKGSKQPSTHEAKQ